MRTLITFLCPELSSAIVFMGQLQDTMRLHHQHDQDGRVLLSFVCSMCMLWSMESVWGWGCILITSKVSLWMYSYVYRLKNSALDGCTSTGPWPCPVQSFLFPSLSGHHVPAFCLSVWRISQFALIASFYSHHHCALFITTIVWIFLFFWLSHSLNCFSQSRYRFLI